MDLQKRSLFQRIRNAKQSLENAEKSFQDDKGMRGELDLMLAEAELKNLRKKEASFFTWNRHMLALSVAGLLVVSGVVGWLFAKENVASVEAKPAAGSAAVVNQQQKTPASDGNKDAQKLDVDNVQPNINVPPKTEAGSEKRVQLSEKDMRQLVRTAKSELSSGK